jgi:hypothetical protein
MARVFSQVEYSSSNWVTGWEWMSGAIEPDVSADCCEKPHHGSMPSREAAGRTPSTVALGGRNAQPSGGQ